MMDHPEKVVEGLKIVVGLFQNAKGCICIEDNKPDCIARMKELAAGVPNIEVKELMTKYPQGGERNPDLCSDRKRNQLIHASSRCRMYCR